MTERERKQQEAAEVTKADRMTGATPKGLSTEQAEAALFDEIGKTTPKTPAEKAQDIILKNMETDMKRSAQEVQESTAQTGRASIKELENAGGLAQLAEMVRAINAAGVSVSDPIYETAAAIRKALQGLYEFTNSDAFKMIFAAVKEAAALAQEYGAELNALQDAPDRIKDLALFLVKELKESDLLEQYTLLDVIEQGFDADGNTIDSPFIEIIKRAENQLAEFEASHTLELLPRIMTTPPDSLEYPIDKINSNIWEDLTEAAKNDPNGQIRFALEKVGSNQEATAVYSINFDELEKLDGLKLTKSLTPFDKRVYIAVNAIYAQNGRIMSAGQIFTAMGNTGKPSKKQLEKVNDSLTKMGAARIYLDNTQEIGVNKGYKHFKYDAPLLPFERVSAYINNALVDSAVHLFREPPLMTFAKERNQITTITKKLLESPVNKTEANLRIDDYLIERIARMKSGRGKTSRKMLYSTIYEKCQIKTKMQRQRAPETIRRYLDYYKECKYITDYKEEADGITIKT